jgi:hypothetical protein
MPIAWRTRAAIGAVIAAASPVAARSVPAQSPAASRSAAISAESLEHRLRVIADDSMMGRETGSLGDFKTAAYVADEFKRLGLTPAGDAGTYFQTVPFWIVAAEPRSSITVSATHLELRRDLLPLTAAAPSLTLEGGRAIYGGPANDTTRWARQKDARGKIVVIDLADLARVSRLVYDAALSIANADERPKLDVPKPADPHARCRQ